MMSKSSRYNPISFNQVTIKDEFWAPKIKVNREVTIPIEYKQCKDTGRIAAYKQDWKPGIEPVPHIFWDSDVAKWIEAASYSLSDHPDSALDMLLDEVIAAIASAQQEDGYLNTHFTAVEPEKRWTNLRDDHELYCAGHMMEAAVAHFQATGKRSLLDVLCKYADYIDHVFGTGPNQKRGYCGHEEIELALIKLYRATGEDRYLKLSSYFVEERGQQPYYFDQEAVARGESPEKFHFGGYAYNQAHKPVREQDKVVGHSVRAMYLYTAMAELSAELNDESLFAACEKLWSHLCTKHMYITGGIGASAANEGFTTDYDLPNETAYCETCASIGLVYWNHRMLQKKCDSRFSDVIEKVLYNGALSGISQDGTRFFYGNPLAAYEGLIPHGNDGNSPDYYRRSGWFGCACCPPNLARLMASLGEYLYSLKEDELAVHLYVQGAAKLQIKGQSLKINLETKYPWDGDMRLRLDMKDVIRFSLKLRIPGWCKKYEVFVNGAKLVGELEIETGYLVLNQLWNPGDEVQLKLYMPIERVYAHPEIKQNVGSVALQRGPIVYCLEQADHEAPIRRMVLPIAAQITADLKPDLLNGVVVLRGNMLVADSQGWEGTLYRTEKPTYSVCTFTAIPYYAWANREPGEMKVWITET
jgi:uncharacterized protein